MFFQSWLSIFLLINFCHVIISLSLSENEPQHKHCKGILINSSDVNPTVQSNSSVTMTVIFNCTTIPHPVTWYSTILGQYTDVTDKLKIVSRDGRYTSYMTSFVIEHLVDNNQGRYNLSVCDESLQYFFVSFDDPGCDGQSPPAAIYSAPNSHYIGPVAINHTMQCYLKGDTSSFDSQVEWNCTNEIVTQSKPGYLLTQSDMKSCSFISSLTLIDVSASESGNCQCYAVTVDGIVGKKQSFENIFLDYPSILSEPKVNSSHTYSLTDPLELEWRVSGTSQCNMEYIRPLLSLNDVYFNTTECNKCLFYFKQDSLLPSYSYLVFKVPSISVLTSLNNTSLRIQVYLKFQPSVSDVVDYNNRVANHSQVTIITVKEVSSNLQRFHWHYVYYGCGSVVLVCIIVLVIGLVACIRRRRRHNLRECHIYQPVPNECTGLLTAPTNDQGSPIRGQTPERDQPDRNSDPATVSSPPPSAVGSQQAVVSNNDLIPTFVTPLQEITPPTNHSLPEEDKPHHSRIAPYIRPSIRPFNFRSGATPLHDLSADTPSISHDELLETTPPNSHDYLIPFVSQGSDIATPSREQPQIIVPPPPLTPETQCHQEIVAPPISRPLKLRVSASEMEEEELERDGPIALKSSATPCKVFVLYCNTSTDGVRAESSAHQVLLFIQLLNLLSKNETHDSSSSYDINYICKGDIFLEPSQCSHITNWSVWTDERIREATHVILVCSHSLYNALQQHTGTTFEMYRGPVSSDMIYNMFTDKNNGCKFIPVFLNSPLQSDLVPAPLRMRRCYTLRLETIFRNFDLLNLSSEDLRKIGVYFDTHYHEMGDFLDLVRLLKNREWE